ncbi:MAG TPA: hypothetical protein ENN80_13130, partial [Candidatus Hydrogenedentes bacterium]|nr:hypothetical protein [Candidatus Hydrogenedentota bacterium]
MEGFALRSLKGCTQLFVLVLLMCGLSLAAAAQAPPPQQSTTGPTPPPGVKSEPLTPGKAYTVIPGVPGYLWRHGSGPTAVGMVVGYWDSKGYSSLVPGSALSESAAVLQVIASGGNSTSPNPPGSELHYEDYARPQDSYPNLKTDDVIEAGRPAHPDDSLADFMDTSKSTRSNYYGWSWSSDIPSAFNDYVNMVDPSYGPSVSSYYMGANLTFTVLKTEIDAGRPMVFLVDTDGNGGTDHFITIVGYDDTVSPKRYVYYNTWDYSLHQADFLAMQTGTEWGIWGGWSFMLEGQVDDEECPETALFAQPPAMPLQPYFKLVSDQQAGLLVCDDFGNIQTMIRDIHWWGFEQTTQGLACQRESNQFEVTFYNDGSGQPASKVAQYIVEPNRTETGLGYNG